MRHLLAESNAPTVSAVYFAPWLHQLELGLSSIATLGELCLEAVSVFCVVIGMIKTCQLAFWLRRRHHSDFPFLQVRTSFGIWLALALEFQLGADILATTIAPSPQALIQLGAIALIRTFLNFFLNHELEKQLELRERSKTMTPNAEVPQ